jgi:O-antigen/teichoic acid export membrane protein
MIFFIIITQILKPWSPWFYRRLEDKEFDGIKSKSNILLTLCSVCCIGLCTVAPDLIKIFLDSNYMNSMYLISPICVGLFFRVVYIFFYDIEYFNKKTKQIALFSIFVCILNIIMNYVFLKLYGYQAAAYTTLASYLLLLIVNYIGTIKLKSNQIYDVKYFAFISLICLFVSYLELIFINNVLMRYLILVVTFVFVVFIQRKNIKESLIMIKNIVGIK